MAAADKSPSATAWLRRERDGRRDGKLQHSFYGAFHAGGSHGGLGELRAWTSEQRREHDGSKLARAGVYIVHGAARDPPDDAAAQHEEHAFTLYVTDKAKTPEGDGVAAVAAGAEGGSAAAGVGSDGAQQLWHKLVLAADSEQARTEFLDALARDEHETRHDRCAPAHVSVMVHIIEVRDVVAKDLCGTSDLVVRVTAFPDSPLQRIFVTREFDGRLSAVFDDKMLFEFEGVAWEDFEGGAVRVEALDADYLSAESIGCADFSLARIHALEHNEMHRAWLALTDEHEGAGGGVQGFISLSVAVLRNGEKRVEQQDDAEPMDEPTTADLGAARALSVRPPSLAAPVPRTLTVDLSRAEALAPLDPELAIKLNLTDSHPIRPFVRCRLGKQKVESSGQAMEAMDRKLHTGTNCTFATQRLTLHYHEPCFVNSIPVEVWDRDRSSSNDLLGVQRLDMRGLREQLREKQHLQGGGGPAFRWLHFYGCQAHRRAAQVDQSRAQDEQCRLPDHGVAYRGRVLYRAQLSEHGLGELPGNGIGDPAIARAPRPGSYRLQLLFAAAQDLPTEVQNTNHLFSVPTKKAEVKRIALAVAIGEHAWLMPSVRVKAEHGTCHVLPGESFAAVFDSQDFFRPPLQGGGGANGARGFLAHDPEQVPDVFVYLVANGKEEKGAAAAAPRHLGSYELSNKHLVYARSLATSTFSSSST
jgi:hypothetical protein